MMRPPRRMLGVAPMDPEPPARRAPHRSRWTVAFLWLALGAGLAAGCGTGQVTLTGAGPIVREARELGPGASSRVDAIELQGALDLDVRVGGPLAVFLEGHGDLLAHVDVELRGAELVVAVARGVRLVPPPRVAIELPELSRLELVGSGTARVGGVQGEALAVALVGSGDVVLEGRVERLELELSGSGELDAGRLVAREVRVDQQGSGRTTVHATELLAGRGVGSGDLECIVRPARSDVRWVGSGQLVLRE